MPFITVRIFQGRLESDAGERLIRNLTDAVVATFDEDVRDATWIVLDPVPEHHWGIAGKPARPTPGTGEGAACGSA